MSRILSSFSNASGDLKSLQNEFSGLFRFFNQSKIKEKADFEPYLNEPIAEITSKILAAQKDLSLFHFSGHSGGSGLDFPDEEFGQQHLVDFFNTINSDKSKLDCVFLNGCENAEIVNQLQKVPVVIGTRTKIQDQVAEKFTRDFFTSLIQAESTYKQAFLDAVSAQSGLNISMIDRTRGEGAAEDLNDDTLNEYFIVINDEKVAASKFPFRKKKTNWTRYIALFLTVVALIIGYLFWGDIMGMIRGYECPKWADDEKCRILVADFNAESTLNINELLAEGIQNNPLVNPHIESKYTEKFSDFSAEKIPGNELHRTCGYDFSLTGQVISLGELYRMDFQIFSDISGFNDQPGEEIQIGNLGELADMIQDVDLNNGNHFILNRLCIACAEEREELIPVIETNMKEYRRTMKSPESYQNLNIQLYSLHKKRGDTTRMFKVLDNIADVGKNDFSLGAIERKAKLLMSSDRLLETYETQSHYVKEIQARMERPAAYKMEKPRKNYQNQQNLMIDNRSSLVWNNRDAMRGQWRQTLNDMQYLQEIQFQNKDYGPQIAKMRDLLGEGREDRFSAAGTILDQDGRPIEGAVIQYENQNVRSGQDGSFDLGSKSIDEVIDKTLVVRLDGYETSEFRISDPRQFSRIRLNKIRAPDKRTYIFKGLVVDCDHKTSILKEIFINGQSIPLRRSVYSHSLSASPGEEIIIRPQDNYRFEDRKEIVLKLGENDVFDETLHIFSDPVKRVITGRISIGNDPIPGANVLLKGTSVGTVTDMNGTFSLTADVDICSEVVCSMVGAASKTFLVKNGKFSGRQINLGDLNLTGTGREEVPEEVEYEIFLQGHLIQPDQYKSIITTLKRSGHNISLKSQNFQQQPTGFPQSPTVTYYADPAKTNANMIARQMNKLTGEKFGIKKFVPEYNRLLSRMQVDNSKKILVQWARQID